MTEKEYGKFGGDVENILQLDVLFKSPFPSIFGSVYTTETSHVIRIMLSSSLVVHWKSSQRTINVNGFPILSISTAIKIPTLWKENKVIDPQLSLKLSKSGKTVERRSIAVGTPVDSKYPSLESINSSSCKLLSSTLYHGSSSTFNPLIVP